MSVKCYETEYKNFGRCVCLDNGIIKLMATIEVGPRIIYFGIRGKDNILFEDLDRDFYEMNRGYGIWYAYGGHRLWTAPEVMPETYLPDNNPVSYTFKNNTLILTPDETLSKKQFRLICEMTEGNVVHITNSITNCSDTPQRFAPWSVTGFASGGTEFIPLCTEKTGFLPNRTMALWSYSSLRDERFALADNYATLQHDEHCNTPFKVGFNVNDGYVVYAANGQVLRKSFAAYEKTDYPDFCCNFETYTNQHFLEVELLGEEREYNPMETASLKETWEITESKLPTNDVISSYIQKI